jgi:hypothetical protein
MATLASSAVTINRSWTEGGVNGKDVSCRQVTLVLTGQGILATDTITAAVLGLSKIEQASDFIDSTSDIIYPAVPSYDGSVLLLANMANATDATRTAPAAITATVRGIVKGYL